MINSLRLQQYRSYLDDSFEFSGSVNIIVGPNASGKTNLLEALLMVCRGSSFRARDAELVGFGKPWARLDAAADKDSHRSVKLEIDADDKTQKTFEVDGQTLHRLSFQKTLPVVLFEPNHLQLLHGSPERRRDFLDDLLEQLTPGFSTTRRHYRRAVAQRNALLKQGHDTNHQLFAWNVRLSDLGGYLADARLQLLSDINSRLSELYTRLAQRQTSISLQYDSAVSADQYSSDLLHKLERSQQHDFERGFTSHGPHRDDISIVINDHPAQEAASRGEVRTLLLALKLIEVELVEGQRSQPPILLLDDVFSELDGARRRALTEVLASHQTFITTTDADVIMHTFSEAAQIIPLQSGPVIPAGKKPTTK